MRTIHVSPEFPLNRRMRKDLRRGKLRVVRVRGEKLSLGGGMANGLPPPFRTFSSPLVCFAVREGGGDAAGGGADRRESDKHVTVVSFCEAYDREIRRGETWRRSYREYHEELGGPEQVEERVQDALAFFLRRFRENAEAARQQLKDAGIGPIGNYPRCYEELEKTRPALVESVDKMLCGPWDDFIQSILKYYGESVPEKFRGDEDYSYYLSSEKAEVLKVRDGIWERREQKERERAEVERQRDAAWADGSMKKFRGLPRADVLAAREIIGKKLDPKDDTLAKLIRELLGDEEFWRKRVGYAGRSHLPDLGEGMSDEELLARKKTRILERAAKFPLKGAATLMARAEISGQDMSDEEIFAQVIAKAKKDIEMHGKEPEGVPVRGLAELFACGAKEVWEGRYYCPHEEELKDEYEELLWSGYFNPDDWVRNLREMPIVAKGRVQFREPVRVRLEEIRRAYFFGNWLSVIALSRCLMEYVLIEALGKDAYRRAQKGGREVKGLEDLKVEMSERKPELKKDMESIQERGNYVMHPRHKSGNILGRREQDARDCFRAIIRIVSVLGGKETVLTCV